MPEVSSLPAVLLLGESESLASLDRRSLRDAGVTHIRVMTSGIQAAKILSGLSHEKVSFQPDIIVCSQKLSDMDGERFCAILRLHPRLLGIPILLILPNDSEAEQLKTLGCGASALLARPYSVTALKEKLFALNSEKPNLNQLKQANTLSSTNAFDQALATYGKLLKRIRQPQDYFLVGMQCLQQKRWNDAINSFQLSLRDAQIKGEAELGIAAAWKGKGDTIRFRAWLARAAETFVKAKRWQRACSTYARLLQEDPQAKSPFLTEVGRLMKQGQYEQAAEVLSKGFDITPKNQIETKVPQACLATDEPQKMLQALEASLSNSLGAKVSVIHEELQANLNTLIKEQETHRRQQASERQWQISQSVQSQETAKKSEFMNQKPEIIEIEDTKKTSLIDKKTENEDFDILPPLTENDATSDLFTSKPRLNELFSIVKYTWNIHKRNKNKS